MGGHPRSESSYPSHLIRVILSESTSPSHLTRMRVTWALPVEVVVEVAPGLLGGHRPPELVQALRGRGGTKRNVPGGVRAGDRVMGRPNTSRRMYRTRGSLSLLLSLSLSLLSPSLSLLSPSLSLLSLSSTRIGLVGLLVCEALLAHGLRAWACSRLCISLRLPTAYAGGPAIANRSTINIGGTTVYIK